MSKKLDILAKARADDFLKVVIEGTAGYYGAQTKLAEVIENKIGEPVSRHRYNRYLNSDPARRTQPSLGVGLLLREAFATNRDYICKQWEGEKRRKPKQKKPKQKETKK